jgi:hypothetical protein
MIPEARPIHFVRRRQTWSIGLYAGPSPLALAPDPQVMNPVLTAEDITDVPAEFVADPFMIRVDERWHLFFELFHADLAKGLIGLATSSDARTWEYHGVVLDEPFHLSYPHVFAWDGEIYMTPETLALGGIALYRAEPFPTRWRRIDTIVRGEFADPTPFRHGEHWWLFAAKLDRRCDTLQLFHAPSLGGRWSGHPASPVIVGDARRARPAGRVVCSGGSLIRFAQDGIPHYGQAVRAFEILPLSETAYQERPTSPEIVLAAGDQPWNRGRVHHVDAHEVLPGRWIACVDGSRPLEQGV